MSCVKIIIRNLSKAAQNRLGTSEATLDVPESFALRLYKSIERLSRLNTISMEAVLGASVPTTPRNDIIFNEYFSGLTVDNLKKYYDVAVIINGHELQQFNRLYIKGRKTTWEFELSRSPDHWVELSRAFKINQLNFGYFNFQKTSIVSNWDGAAYEGDYTADPNIGQPPYYFGLVDYGGFCDFTEPAQGSTSPAKTIAVEDFRPLLSLPFILRAGACAIGWTLNGVIFDSELMKRAWVYALKPNYYDITDNAYPDAPTERARGGRIRGRVSARYQWQKNVSVSDFYFQETIFALSDYFVDRPGLLVGGYCGVNNYSEVSLKYRFYFNGEFHNDRASPFTAIFVVEEFDIPTDMPTGEILSTESVIIEFAAHEKKRVIFEQEVVLRYQQAAVINLQIVPNTGFYVEAGGYFSVDPANKSLMKGDLPLIAECVSDSTTLFDWIKATAHLFRLDVETDYRTKTLTFHPRYTANAFGDTIPGFFKYESPAIDINDRIVTGSEIITPNRQDVKRYTRIEFANSTDAYIDSLNLSEPAHSRTINNGDELPDEIESIQNIIIEPTFEGRTTGIVASGSGNRSPFPYLARLWDNTEGQRSFNIGPRILFAYGVCRQINPNPVNETNELTSFFFEARPNPSNTGLTTDFGYVSQLRTWEITPAATPDGNLSFNSLPVINSDLFTIFYLGFTQQQRNGSTIEVLMNLKMNDYQAINFRDLYTFRLKGRTYRVPMIDIRDFDTCGETATPVKFQQDPVFTECCDRPCGCQFIKCDYYQDLGIYLQQATLDDMAVASFQVDNIELLSAPIPLGKIKIVGIDANPYITNLVDVLKSIGAPYFTFEYSNRLHPQKGKRFFTIKRPACYTFRILITLNGDDCYLYTDTEQLSQYFTPGTWSALGYGTETFTAPDNCVQTTEY